MKTIKHDLSADFSFLEVHIFADLHLGDKHTDYSLIKKRIDYIKNTPNAYVILNGDLFNNATKTSLSDNYAEEIPPMEQIQEGVALFTPIQDKLLAITTGNHEGRTYKREGIDLTEIMARQMKLYPIFSKSGAFIFVRFGKLNANNHHRKNCYTIYTIHGRGGGRKEGAKAIRLADMASIVDADIYIHSHTHLPITMKQSFHRVNYQNSVVYPVDKLFVNTGATLDYGGYSEVYEFKPTSKATPVIYLSGNERDMTAKL